MLILPTLEDCEKECSKRTHCGEFYFKNGKCYLANGKCKPKENPKNPENPKNLKNPNIK